MVKLGKLCIITPEDLGSNIGIYRRSPWDKIKTFYFYFEPDQAVLADLTNADVIIFVDKDKKFYYTFKPPRQDSKRIKY